MRNAHPFSRAFLWLFASALIAGCGSSTDEAPGPLAPASIDDDLPSACSPLRFAGTCALPFPNAIDTRPDSSSPTGRRLALEGEGLPAEAKNGILLNTERYNRADGFSPATPVLAYFPERIDPESLPFMLDPESSLSPKSATVIVDMETRELVAHFTEVDRTVEDEDFRQGLLIRPLTRLETGRRYAVAITRSIRTMAGTVPSSPPLFGSIVNGTPPNDPRAQAQAERMPEILTALASVGVMKDDLVLAWDFVTASDGHITGNLLSMREQALEQIGDEGIGYEIAKVEENPGEHILRRITGTYKVPRFLSEPDSTVAASTFEFDEKGLPKWRGDTYDVPFSMIIPDAANDGPLPLMLFGHGLFGSGVDYMTYPEIQAVAHKYGWIVVATDWTGLSKWELPGSGASGAAVQAISDLNNLPFVTDRLQQSIINAIALTRTARGKLADDEALRLGGEEGSSVVAKDQPIGYFGISLGGIMGTTFMAYSPDVPRGVTNVAGSTWSLMFQRSSNWSLFNLVIGGTYPEPLDQQVLLAIAQSQFDFTDPINAAPHVVHDPLPGTPAKQILQQMSVADAQVPNVSSEILARTMGIPLLSDSPLEIWGMPPKAGPLQSALGVWDLTPQAPSVPKPDNSTPKENKVHAALSQLEPLQEQTDHFLRTGEILSTCDGTCVFDVALD